MARKFVSPGVFTQEIDQSYLAQGVASIGAAVIGRTAKGPAFVPTLVTDFSEFAAKFGDVDPNMQMPYAAKNYLKNANNLTVVRVLGTKDGNIFKTNGSQLNPYALTGTLSSSGGTVTGSVLAIVHIPVGYTGTFTATGTGSTFTYYFTGSNLLFAGTGSFDTTSPDYIGNALNTDPTKVSIYGHYVYKNFKWAHEGWLNPGSGFGVLLEGTGSIMAPLAGVSTTASYDYDFTWSQTPMVKSQPYGANGANTYDLFSFETLSAGAASTTDVKVSIVNIFPSLNPNVYPYGQFDVIVRAWSDTDQRMVQVETFTACNLDPKSTNYVARRIGNQKFEWDSTNRKNTVTGLFKRASRYIRIDMATSADLPEDALPWGHAGYAENTVQNGVLCDLPYTRDNLDSVGNVEPAHVWGVNFQADGVSERLKALAEGGTTQVSATPFSLTHVSGTTSLGTSYCVYNTSYWATTPEAAIEAQSPVAAARNGFTLAFAGGFDGFDMTDANPAPTSDFNSDRPLTVTAFKAAIDSVSNPDEIDMNLLVLPGITTPSVIDYGRTVCNNRADCMMIMDIAGSSVNDVIGQINSRGIDDNYVACYYPDLRYADTTNNILATVKPSVAVLGAYAYSDRVKAPYFAPAGLNRGGLSQFGIVDTADRLTFQDRNDLYENRINPIATFPNEGINVFGQKTMQARPSALDRVNVRRLLIYAKKTIASAAKYLLFEPNNPNTWQRFLNTVNPILEEVRMAQGLERFKVVMDTTTNPPDMIDRNIMTGKIFLQPTKAAEYIDLSFIVTSSGVQFGE